jgi:hypothetical protein
MSLIITVLKAAVNTHGTAAVVNTDAVEEPALK